MPAINTNAIRAFSDKVRVMATSNSKSITLSQQEARNLNHEIQQLMALILEAQSQAQGEPQTLEIAANKW